jgi:hypothetical protein
MDDNPKNKENDAYTWYVLISIGWFFISGPFAILAFVELGVGDMLARKIKGQESTVDKKNIDSVRVIDADFTEVNINDGYVQPRKPQAKLINRSFYTPKTEVIGRGQCCSYN